MIFSIILPTYNESNNINPLLRRISTALGDTFSYEILFIDDSTDNTPEIIKNEIKNFKNVRLIKRNTEQSTGLATAFVRGFDEAKGKFILCMDSDLQHPPELIPYLFKKIINHNTDIVVASRYAKGGSAEGLDGPFRKLVSIALRYVVWLILYPTRKTSDPGSGFFIFNKELIDNSTLNPKGFKILIEILTRANPRNVFDVAYRFEPRENSESKATYMQGIKFFDHLRTLATDLHYTSRFIRYAIVGLAGTVVNLMSLFVLVNYFNVGPLTAWLFAILLSITTNYFLNRNFTFSDKKTSTRIESAIQYSFFALLSIVTIGINFIIYSLLLKVGVYYLFSSLVGIVFGTLLNYYFSTKIIWKTSVRSWRLNINKRLFRQSIYKIISVSILALLLSYSYLFLVSLPPVVAAVTIFSIFLSAQGIFSVFLMLWIWEDPKNVSGSKSPKVFLKPQYSFTAIIPARHEQNVIAQTIETISNLDYPEELKEVLVVCREDDVETIVASQNAISKLNKENVRLIVFNGFPINKPHGLNIALNEATNEIVTVFDAEDEPHRDLYKIINTILIKKNVDIVQSGVQLMNYDSNWYSLFNVLEYFFWFKSSLHFFAQSQMIPLGGNSVFFKKEWLVKVGGWDQNCLTEDADVGIRMSIVGAKTAVVYDENHVTQEETPPTLMGLIKQRTRWNQGFLQVFGKGDWMDLKTWTQKMLCVYVLIWPIAQSLLLLFIPVSIYFAFVLKINTLAAIITNVPLYLLVVNMVIYIIGLHEFTTAYKKKFSWTLPFKVILMMIPYQIILGISAFRATTRQIMKINSWEKTKHINAHRALQEI